jgi:hypothetical protein
MIPALTDKYLLNELITLRDKFDIKYFFETGSWKGYSSNIASKYFEKVFSCEVDEGLFNEAVMNNQNNSNVSLFKGNSPLILNTIVTREHEDSIFFLDAHWYGYVPLNDELSVIKSVGIKPVIVIHDFFTPTGDGSSKFEYDKYGDTVIGFDLVKDKIEQIYDGKFVHYCLQDSEINSGVGIFCKL